MAASLLLVDETVEVRSRKDVCLLLATAKPTKTIVQSKWPIARSLNGQAHLATQSVMRYLFLGAHWGLGGGGRLLDRVQSPLSLSLSLLSYQEKGCGSFTT